MKLQVMGEQDHIFVNEEGAEKDQKYFMYLVTPDEVDENDLGTWEGSIKRMTRVHERSLTQLKT